MADIECLGMLATLLVIASFVFQNIVLIRLVNGIGAALFIAYGAFIHSPSVIIVNVAIVGVQVVHLVKLNRQAKANKRMGLPPMIHH